MRSCRGDVSPNPPRFHDDHTAPAAQLRISGPSAYQEKVGRPTGSANVGYLKWKIRQAEKGRIRVGPAQRRHGDGPPPDFKVLPLRMEADLVVQLDEARERLGLGSRMDLFRRSPHAFLLEAGEVRVAELFAPEA